MWYVTKHSRTELDEETHILIGVKRFQRQYRIPLDAMQADALSANKIVRSVELRIGSVYIRLLTVVSPSSTIENKARHKNEHKQ